MITQAILGFLFDTINFGLGLLPSGSPPSWITSASTYTGYLWDNAANLGAWIPWGLGATVVASWFASLTIAIAVRIVRFLISISTGGGGAA